MNTAKMEVTGASVLTIKIKETGTPTPARTVGEEVHHTLGDTMMAVKLQSVVVMNTAKMEVTGASVLTTKIKKKIKETGTPTPARTVGEEVHHTLGDTMMVVKLQSVVVMNTAKMEVTGASVSTTKIKKKIKETG